MRSRQGKKNLNTKSDVVFSLAAYIIACIIVLILFFENFVFSSGFDTLQFREIDDLAFQASLRKIHLWINSGQLFRLFVLNDYAYGWIFWFPIGLITYPLYLISTHFAIDWPLIVVPREISLAFAIGTLLIVRQILKIYHASEWVLAGGMLVFLLFPIFGYISLKFGTSAEIMFFSALSLYLAISDCPSTKRGRIFAVSALALAASVKLSGLFIAPLIVLIIALRYKFNTFSKVAYDFMFSSILFIFLLIVFSNPSLLAYPFSHKLGQHYFEILTHFIGVTKNDSLPINQLNKFYDAFLGSIVNLIWMSILTFGLIGHAIRSKYDRLDFFSIILVLVLIVTYLFYEIGGSLYIQIYFTSVSFLLLLGLIFYNHSNFGKFILIMISLLELTDLINKAYKDYTSDASSNIGHLMYFIKDIKSENAFNESKKLNNCLNIKNKNWSGHIFIDYDVPNAFNSLSYPSACISYAWNNLSATKKYCGISVDYIVMNKRSPGMLEKDKFEARIKISSPKIVQELLEDRESRRKIMAGDFFDNHQYIKKCDLESMLVYEAIK